MKYRHFVFWATFAVVAVVVFGICNFYPLLQFAGKHKREFLLAATIGTITAAGVDAVGQRMKFSKEDAKPHDNVILTGKLVGAMAIILLILSRANDL